MPMSESVLSEIELSILDFLKFLDYCDIYQDEIINTNEATCKDSYLRSIFPMQLEILIKFKIIIENKKSKVTKDHILGVTYGDEESNNFLLKNYLNMPLKVFELLKL